MSNERPLRVGLCGIGLDAYWSQFARLEQRLQGYVEQVGARLTRPGVEVVNLGLVDTPARSSDAGHHLRTLEHRPSSGPACRRAGCCAQPAT